MGKGTLLLSPVTWLPPKQHGPCHHIAASRDRGYDDDDHHHLIMCCSFLKDEDAYGPLEKSYIFSDFFPYLPCA